MQSNASPHYVLYLRRIFPNVNPATSSNDSLGAALLFLMALVAHMGATQYGTGRDKRDWVNIVS